MSNDTLFCVFVGSSSTNFLFCLIRCIRFSNGPVWPHLFMSMPRSPKTTDGDIVWRMGAGWTTCSNWRQCNGIVTLDYNSPLLAQQPTPLAANHDQRSAPLLSSVPSEQRKTTLLCQHGVLISYSALPRTFLKLWRIWTSVLYSVRRKVTHFENSIDRRRKK